MAVSVLFPKSGMGITEGTIVKWLKAVGDRVEQSEIIAEIETAKTVLEIEAPVAGALASIRFQEGDEVEVEAEIATIEEG
ncbi:biotin/lipoyl-containing protein [Phenylobacterium zucineum]|uniref:biotin/lipoyl-containing protein n=1 Tax=Phenylobacterium zucineum TaxID=284016 RepID=UPI00031989D2|nr:biotin/lipoyl-containing protein [Phenylobacterium zucineum]